MFSSIINNNNKIQMTSEVDSFISPSTVHTPQFTNPAAVFNELDNQRPSVTTRRQLNSQKILRINQYIDNQGKKINNSLTTILCVAIFSILLGSIGIGLFVAYNNDLCDEYQTSSYCDRTYWAVILGCMFIFLCISLIIIYCTMKAKLIRVKKLWQEKIVQLQQTLV